MTDEDFEIGKKILARQASKSVTDIFLGQLHKDIECLQVSTEEKRLLALVTVQGKLHEDTVYVLKLNNDLLVRESCELFFVYDTKPTARICIDISGEINICENQDSKQDFVFVDCDTSLPFLDIELALIKSYGIGCWVVYCDQSLTIHRTSGSARSYAHRLPGGKLIRCIGHGMKRLFNDY